MPSGKAHQKLAVATSPLLVIAGWVISGFSYDIEVWLGIGTVVVGYLANPFCLSPDMDLPESAPSNKWRAAEPIWWPYQALIHRGALSHWPPLSSLLRIGYLWLMLFIIGVSAVGIVDLIAYGLLSGQILIPLEWVKLAFVYWLTCWKFPTVWRFIWGLALADGLHVVSDAFFSYMKK